MKTPAAFKVGRLTCRPFHRTGDAQTQWQLDIPPRYMPSGRRKRILFPSRRAAQEEATRLNRQLEVQAHLNQAAPLPSGMLLTEAADLWTDEQVQLVQAGAKRAGSQITAAYQLKPLLAFMGTTDLQAVTSQKVLDYQAHRATEGRKPSTINSEVAKLRQLMAWAVERKLCTTAPKARSLPLRRRRIDLPTIDEMARIISQMDPARGLVVQFLVETGCRKSEAFNLRWRDVDLDQNLIRIRPSDGFTPKTAHSERDIPVHPSLTRALKQSRGKQKADAYVFPGKGGGARTEVDKALNTAAKAAGVRRGDDFIHLDHHTLRKAHATWQAMAGLPESILQIRLGHVPGSRVTQQHYVHAAQAREPDGAIRVPTKRRAKRSK